MEDGKVAYSIPEASKRMSIGRTAVYAEIKAKRLQTVKVGRRTLVTRAALEAWVTNLMREQQ